MSIYGIGVDQVDLKRVKRLLNKSEDKFLKRCFTEQEIKYAKRFSDPSKRLGARFAAKAVSYTHLTLPTTPYV